MFLLSNFNGSWEGKEKNVLTISLNHKPHFWFWYLISGLCKLIPSILPSHARNQSAPVLLLPLIAVVHRGLGEQWKHKRQRKSTLYVIISLRARVFLLLSYRSKMNNHNGKYPKERLPLALLILFALLACISFINKKLLSAQYVLGIL